MNVVKKKKKKKIVHIHKSDSPKLINKIESEPDFCLQRESIHIREKKVGLCLTNSINPKNTSKNTCSTEPIYCRIL